MVVIRKGFVVAAMSLLAPSSMAQSVGTSDVYPPVAPEFRKSEEAAPLPVTPSVLPPDLPPRPPLVPVRALPNSQQPIGKAELPPHKPSLAWRAKAHALKQSKTAPQQMLNCNYDSAIMALISCLSRCGLRVETLNAKAGELLACHVDAAATQRYVFVFAEMPPGVVTIKGMPLKPSKQHESVIHAVFQGLLEDPVRGKMQ